VSKKRRRPHSSIALVGNAPLDAADRPAVAGADFIIRFNWMHHRWLPQTGPSIRSGPSAGFLDMSARQSAVKAQYFRPACSPLSFLLTLPLSFPCPCSIRTSTSVWLPQAAGAARAPQAAGHTPFAPPQQGLSSCILSTIPSRVALPPACEGCRGSGRTCGCWRAGQEL